MIQNNNTKDVAYLGYGDSPIPRRMIEDIYKNEYCDVPQVRVAKKGIIYVFDCSGTRYGFRIKELKNK